MAKDFEQQKQAIWRKVQREVDFRVSKEAQIEIDAQAGPIYSDDDLKYYEDSVSDRVRLLKLEVECGHFPPPRKPKDQAPQKRYQKPFEKRLHLVDFVIGKQLSLKGLTRRKFTPTKRINWKLTCEAWNEAHPYDNMTPAVLKATYYRAITEKALQEEFFNRKIKEFNERIAETMKPFAQNMAKTLKMLSEKFEEAPSLLIPFWKSAWCLGNALAYISLHHTQELLNENENPITINLDKERHLKYTYSSLSHSFERPLADIGLSIANGTIEERISDISTLLLAGLIWEDPSLTKEQIGDFVSSIDVRSLPYIFDTTDEALSYIVA